MFDFYIPGNEAFLRYLDSYIKICSIVSFTFGDAMFYKLITFETSYFYPSKSKSRLVINHENVI